MRRAISLIAATALALTLGVGVAIAAEPFASCGASNATLNPPGFDSGGFANAEANYAGSDNTPSLNSGNDHAVSQYDIACVHFTSAHS